MTDPVPGPAVLPYFAAPWGADVVGVVLSPAVEQAEIVELVTESFLVQAPRMLREAVERLLPGE